MTAPELSNRLFLVDGSSLAYRAYFAIPETIATGAGFPTNALYGFGQMLLKIVTDYTPATVVVAWDAGEKTFRHDEYEEYKAQRPHMPEPLSLQWPHLEELVSAFGFANLKLEGYEADDILGTLAENAKRRRIGSVVVTGDRDALQIVDDDIWVMATGRGISEVKIYTPAAVVERYGITPDKVPDFIGFKGDTSDNIPGVPGIGEKTAAALIQEFGSMDAVYEHLSEVKSEKRRALLAEHEAQARLSRRLATMVLDVPLSEDVGELVERRGHALPVREVEEFFRRYEFGSLVRRLHEASGRQAGPAAPPAGRAGVVAAETGAAQERAGVDAVLAPRLVVESGLGALAAILEQKEAALAVAAFPDSGSADVASATTGPGAVEKPEVVAAVFDGGSAVLAARVPRDQAAGLWRLAAHVVAHDAKAQPGYAAAPSGPAFDTAIAAYLLAPERPEGDLDRLAGAAEEETLVDGPRDEARAASRAVLTWRLAERQRPRLLDLGLERLFREIELPLVHVLARMEVVGVKMDPYRLGEITAGVRERIEEVGDRICDLAGGPFTIGSPQQLAEVLFSRLGLEPVRKGKTGFSTDARVLRTLREQHPIVPLIEEWRELTKLLNTYLEPLPARLDPSTGRLHTTFNQTATTTGRLSSSNPNLQNIPVRTELGSQIRACFVAELGCRLVVADYSQIELRLMAHLAEEPALLDAYRLGEDVHRVTAAAVAGIAPEEVTREQRERAKATNFGIMYGLSAYGLSEQVGMPVDEARAFIEAYFARYPRVREFRERIIREAAEEGYVKTLFGRRRAMPELRGHTQRERALGERLAVNTVLQGSAADIIKVAMIAVERKLSAQSLAARLVLQVHDELVLEAPEAEVESVVPLVHSAMCDAFVMDPPLESSVGVGENWLSAK
jgi:DNA polymerase-1